VSQKSLYQDETHVPGQHYFIYKQEAAEIENDELKK
jgi:hypothetical protein